MDVDKVERRMIASLTDLQTGRGAAGAQAIWRDGPLVVHPSASLAALTSA